MALGIVQGCSGSPRARVSGAAGQPDRSRPEQPRARRQGRLVATAPPPPPRRPRAAGERFSWPRRICASTSPASTPRLPTVSRSGQPSSSASANFSPALRVAVVVEHVQARLAQLARRGGRPPRGPPRPPCRASPARRRRAPVSAARRCPARRRTARWRRPRCAPARSRRSPSRSSCSLPDSSR